jgi:hypothetical protein
VSRSRRRSALLVLLLVVVVNLPLAHSTWQRAQVRRSGVHVTATVTEHRLVGSEHWLSFRLPARIDAERETRQAEVDGSVYDDAVATGKIGVRVLEDDPSAYEVDGAVQSHTTLVVTLVLDLLLVLLALVLWRFGGPRRAELRAVALEDVRPGEREVLLERIGGEDYLVRGEVVDDGDGRVVLDLGNRTIVVLLDGHANPVGHRQAAQVRARMIG